MGGRYQTIYLYRARVYRGAGDSVLIRGLCSPQTIWLLPHDQEAVVIRGLNHLTLAVADVERSFAFYCHVLGFQPRAKWPRGAYLLAGDVWLALVVDPTVRTQPLPEYTHIAFTVAPDQFAILSDVIRAAQAPIWQDNWTEGDSLYFVDPDGHKLEIHTSDVATRLRLAKEQPWEGLEFFV